MKKFLFVIFITVVLLVSSFQGFIVQSASSTTGIYFQEVVSVKKSSSSTYKLDGSNFKKVGDKLLTGMHLKKATNQFDGYENVIELEFKNTGKERLAVATKRLSNYNGLLGIFVDGKLVSAPIVAEEIDSNICIINGGSTIKEAKDLTDKINKGIELDHAVNAFKFNQVTNRLKIISGIYYPNKSVKIMIDNNTYNLKVNTAGKWSLKIDKSLSIGTKIVASISLSDGSLVNESTYVIPTTPTVRWVKENSKYVKGTAVKGSTVYVNVD